MKETCSACGGRGSIKRERSPAGVFARFRRPEQYLDRCSHCEGTGVAQKATESTVNTGGMVAPSFDDVIGRLFSYGVADIEAVPLLGNGGRRAIAPLVVFLFGRLEIAEVDRVVAALRGIDPDWEQSDEVKALIPQVIKYLSDGHAALEFIPPWAKFVLIPYQVRELLGVLAPDWRHFEETLLVNASLLAALECSTNADEAKELAERLELIGHPSSERSLIHVLRTRPFADATRRRFAELEIMRALGTVGAQEAVEALAQNLDACERMYSHSTTDWNYCFGSIIKILSRQRASGRFDEVRKWVANLGLRKVHYIGQREDFDRLGRMFAPDTRHEESSSGGLTPHSEGLTSWVRNVLSKAAESDRHAGAVGKKDYYERMDARDRIIVPSGVSVMEALKVIAADSQEDLIVRMDALVSLDQLRAPLGFFSAG